MSFIYSILKKEKDKPIEAPELESLDRPVADKKSNEPEWQKIHGIVDERLEETTTLFFDTAVKTKESVEITETRDGFSNGDANRIDRAVDWDLFEAGLSAIPAVLGAVLILSGQELKMHLPPKMRSFKFTLEEAPGAARWIERHGAELITNISEETRKALRAAVKRAQVDNLGAYRASNHIRSLIGLTDRQMKAVDNFRRNLQNQGILNSEEIFQSTKNYADKQLQYRAKRIARNELMTAANQGHVEMYNEAARQGLINADLARKEWVVTPDDRLCELCAPMAGVTVKLNEPFPTVNGLLQAPPLHVMCRCTINIIAGR